MERRKEARIDINQEVTVTVLGEPDGLPFRAVAIDLSGNGIRILSPHAVPYQAVVKVEAGELLLLGEVIRVQPSRVGSMLAVQLQHSVDSLGELRRLNQALRLEEYESLAVERPSAIPFALIPQIRP